MRKPKRPIRKRRARRPAKSPRDVAIESIREELKKTGPVVGFDPGVKACGFAVFTAECFPKPFLCDVAYIQTNEEVSSPFIKINSIFSVSCWALACFECLPSVWVVEFPRVMSGTRGEAAARKGDVLHLAHFCGMVHSEAIASDGEFIEVDAGKWKGQLSKELVEERLSRLIGTVDANGKDIDSHGWDACGIALTYLGVSMDDKELLGGKDEKA